MNVSIVHDYLIQYGGAERIIEVFHELFPEAPVYTSIYVSRFLPDSFKKMNIQTSFLQKFPLARRGAQKEFLLLYPLAFRRFNLKDYDVVLSSSAAWAKGIITPHHVCHICYCHSLMRFAWSFDQYVKREDLPRLLGKILPLVVAPLKRWDMTSSRRVNYFIANSKLTANRIGKIYKRKATIIYPPVRCSDFTVNNSSKKDSFLIVSRLAPYKRIDIAIEAFNRLALPLMIVGEGRDRKSLEKIAGSNIHFMGRASGDELRLYYSNCRAFILPGEEDFGMTSLEAQASGRPVIAYAAGGALESVIEGKTGTFFHEQTPEALIRTVKKLDRLEFDSRIIRKHAEKFDVEVFKRKIKSFLEEKLEEHQRALGHRETIA